MITTSPDSSFASIASMIRRGLEKEIAIIAGEETKKAVQHANEQIQLRVKQSLPQVATGFFNRFTMEQPWGKQELVIRVDLAFPNETSDTNRKLS